MERRQLSTVAKGAAVIGTVAVAAGLLSQAIRGSVFTSNVVGRTDLNPNVSFILGTNAFFTPTLSVCTATGGLTTYDTCLITSPYNSSASTRGLKTGTGVVQYLQFDMIANPKGVTVDCTKAAAAKTATGGTLLVTDATATGSVVTYTTPFTLGPTEVIKCGARTDPGANFSAQIRAIFIDSNVTN